jgi:MSHA biogenesis protein MshP
MALIAGIFLLLVLGALAAAVVNLTARAASSSANAVQSARTEQAARAAIEWGAWQVLHASLAPGPQLPACFASPTNVPLPAAFDHLAVSVSCSRSPIDAQGSQQVAIYRLSATATFGRARSIEHIERRVERSVERCIAPHAPSV